MWTLRVLLGTGLMWAGAVSMWADVLHLHDGRTFEGQVTDEGAAFDIDAMVSGIRVKLSFPKAQVARIVQQPIPEGFYEPGSAIVLAESDADTGTPYLVVPIEGELGLDVIPQGIEAALAYAARQGIGDIVFTLNSTGGNVEATRQIAQLLDRYDQAMRYHAIVERAEGLAMIVPVRADSLFMRPGATMGGVDLDDLNLPDLDASVAASHAAAVASEHGRDGRVILAMVLPEERLAAWRDEQGKVVVGSLLPEDVEEDRVVFVDIPHTRLTLDRDSAVAIGFAQPLDGGPEDLGAVLGHDDWQAPSDYGRSAMQTAIERQATQQRIDEAQETRRGQQISRNQQQHDELLGYILANFAEYQQSHPAGGDYATYIARDSYKNRWGRRHYTFSYDTQRMTKDSRHDWQLRTERAINALQRIRKALARLDRLDREAQTLGIVRHTDAQLSEALTDAQGKPVTVTISQLNAWAKREINYLTANRGRKSR